MTTYTTTLVKRQNDADKKHSVVFVNQPTDPTVQDIVSSVYLNRPMVNGHTKAKLTIEFLD